MVREEQVMSLLLFFLPLSLPRLNDHSHFIPTFADKGKNNMRLSDKWFMALSENEAGQLITLQGRDELSEFKTCGKLKERVEVTWPYESSDKGLPSEALAEQMEAVEAALRKAMEKDKLAILSGVYTGGGEKVWVFYTRTTRVFGERLNEALAPFEQLPITLYAELDPEWEEYQDLYEMKQWAID